MSDQSIPLAINLIEKRRDDYIAEHMRTDPETGCLDGKDAQFEYIGELDDIIEMLKRTTNTGSTKAPDHQLDSVATRTSSEASTSNHPIDSQQ